MVTAISSLANLAAKDEQLKTLVAAKDAELKRRTQGKHATRTRVSAELLFLGQVIV